METFIEIETAAQVSAAALADAGFHAGFDWARLVGLELVVGLYVGETLRGLIAFKRDKQKFNFIDLVEVPTQYQGQGYGAKLLAIVLLDALLYQDFEGFAMLASKYNGVQHFYLYLGAFPSGQNMLFMPEDSERIVAHYLPQGGKSQWTLNK